VGKLATKTSSLLCLLWLFSHMPIYEYECAKCGKRIEVIQKMSDKPLKKHADCGGTLTKLISAAGFQFKGTGWYVTDYARKGSAAETKSETSESKDSPSTKDGSSNGNKEGSSKAGTEKAGKKDGGAKSSSKKE
jgi:putative FmdB family regulatory protein